MNRIKKAANSIVEFANDHKTAITIFAVGTVTTALCAQVSKLSTDTFVNYIEEKGLTDDFKSYLTEEDR